MNLPHPPLAHVLALRWAVVGVVVLRFMVQKRERIVFFITGLIGPKIGLERGFSISDVVRWIRAAGAICLQILQVGDPTVGSIQP